MRRQAPRGGIGRYRGGQFIDTATLRLQAQDAVSSMGRILEDFGVRLQFLRAVYEQNAALRMVRDLPITPMPLSTIEYQMKATIRDVYERAFLAGKRSAGNLFGITPDEAKAIRRSRLDEYKWLRKFLADIRGGGGRMGYQDRMDYYRGAAREIFWLGWVLADTRPSRKITWHWGDTVDHCSDCRGYANHGPYTVADFRRNVMSRGHLPQSGALECMGYSCRCWLSDNYGILGKDNAAKLGGRA